MKSVFGLVVVIAVLSACLTLCITALYAAGGLAASQTARQIPVVGDMVGDRIYKWVLGGYEENVIDEQPWDVIEVEPGGVISWTGEIEFGDDCEVPVGLPSLGPVKWFFRESRYPSHTGIDISVITGSPVWATMCGVVVYAGWSSVGYGYLVVVENGDYQTYYAHNSSIVVSVGQEVGVGQLLASSGSTGNSTGPHVHYEVRVRGAPVDPCEFVGCRNPYQ